MQCLGASNKAAFDDISEKPRRMSKEEVLGKLRALDLLLKMGGNKSMGGGGRHDALELCCLIHLI